MQWLVSLVLLVYLLVPGYSFEKEYFDGDNYFNPYEHWNDNPAIRIIYTGNKFSDENGRNLLYSSAVDLKAPVYLLDTVPRFFTAKFFAGYSKNTIQYLIFKQLKDNPDAAVLLKPASVISGYTPFKGLSLIKISDSLDENYLDTLLDYGRPVFAMASRNEGYTANLVSNANEKPADLLAALKNGRNLMVFSDDNPFTGSQSSIPVIHSIEWKRDVIHLDLSEPGEISLIASGFRLDTLARNLALRIIGQDWIRFKVKFQKKNITYLSNAIIRTGDEIPKLRDIKSDNLRTIFINLIWLVAIVLFNLVLNRIRQKIIS